MKDLGRGAKVFDHDPVSGTWRAMESPDDVLELMGSGAEGVVALVRDAGATFLDGEPGNGDAVEVDCSGPEGIVRA